MNARILLALTILFTAFLTRSSFAATPPPIRILPVGDSITYGSSVNGGYRLPLWNLLTNAGFNVDFTGTQTGNSTGMADPDHEGHGGWRIDQIDGIMAGVFASTADPDLILLLIGTNDYGQNYDQANATNRLEGLIARMATSRPLCKIIVANLLEREEPNNTEIQTTFNSFVQSICARQRALGREVYFQNLRAALPVSDMPDALHPGALGYAKMGTNWFGAITNHFSPFGSTNLPALTRAVGAAGWSNVVVTYSKPVADNATNIANYSVSSGLTISGATLDASRRVVTLGTSLQTPNTSYTLTVSGVQDMTAAALTIPSGSTVAFNAAPVRGVFNNVAEATNYTLVYSLEIPDSATYGTPNYAVINTNFGGFSRVAYYMELQQAGGPLQVAWVSMDPFTQNAAQIGVPTVGSGSPLFQQPITNMNVYSTVAGVVNGTALSGGNMEFWSGNYAATNTLNVTNASITLYDWGDQMTPGGHASMQLHNSEASQTIMAFNHWGTSGGLTEIGIGNGSPNPDWTFANNGPSYVVKTLQVLALPVSDTTQPTLVRAIGSNDYITVRITFSEPLDEASATNIANYTPDGAITLLSATLDPATRSIVTITTSAQTPMSSYTIWVSDVYDRFGNPIDIGSPATFTASSGSGVFVNIPESTNYTLIYSLNIPAAPNYLGGASYDVDLRPYASAFSRIGYYLELQTAAGAVTYVWASMDAFTTNVNHIGVPTPVAGTYFQQPVTNMNVLCSVAGVTTGAGLSGGNIEFWPWNYSAPNALAVPNAGGTLDWGDTVGLNSGNYGAMQIHNNAASQVVMAFNRWGGVGGNCDIGIGNNTSTVDADWTFVQNGANYSVRRLQVLVLPVNNTNPPVLVRASGQAGSTTITLTFSEPLADDATTLSHYAVSGGLVVSAASLDLATKTIVTLTTTAAPQPGSGYTVTVNGLKDRSSNQTLIAANSTASFSTISSATGGGVHANVPESVNWTLVASLDVPTATAYNNSNILYAADNRAGVTNYTRVAYYLELATAGGPTNFVWAAMDPFTADGMLLGVPVRSSGALFQQPVTNLTVYSSVSSINAGHKMSGGNLEFWPWDYQEVNAANVPNASGSLFDFGDRCATNTGGYGSMQIHNSAGRQTLFALDNFGGSGGGDLCLGIGNNTSSTATDWTHMKNAATYVHRKLQVFVLPTTDSTAPTLASAIYTLDLAHIVVTFSEPLSGNAAALANFSIDGLVITDAVLNSNLRQVTLTTAPISSSSNYILTVSGVRDRSAGANLITPGSTIAITGPTVPPQILANAAESSTYKLAYQLSLPSAVPNWNGNGTVYDIDNRTYLPPFSRVAYYLELATNGGPTNWVYVSMDAFTADPNKIGVPDMVSGGFFQQKVTNMNVLSDVPSIVTGSAITTGNMEFWPLDYAVANAAGIPNASAANFDWGDSTNVASFGVNGHGAMQFHNHGAYGTGQVLFAFNKWGGGQTGIPGLGIGSRQGNTAMDWTAADNAGTYVHKRLYILVQPAADSAGPLITRAVPSGFRTNVVVIFNEILTGASVAPTNFTVNNGLTVSAAVLRPNLREIVLTTSAQTPGTVYTLTVSNVTDRAGSANVITPGSTVNFTASPDLPLYGRAAEATNYLLVQHMALPSAVPNYNVNGINYTIDQRGSVLQPFNRVAYYLELATNVGGPTNWVYVSADAFTTNINRVGIPVIGTGGGAQQRLTNMNVLASDATIISSNGLTTGNIEFWGCNYGGGSNNIVPTGSASTGVFDWNDTFSSGGYGSMQIHNWGAYGTGQVLFAYNKWGGGQTGNGSIGIGTRPGNVGMDWTFGDNANTYAVKNLHILVRPTNAPPAGSASAAPAPAFVVLHPAPRTNQVGDTTTLTTVASGSATLNYQWRRNGSPITDATNSWLTLLNAQASDSGNYDVVVTNNAGSSASLVAVVSINRAPTVTLRTGVTLQNQAFNLGSAMLLQAGSDPDGDALALASFSATSTNGGAVTLNPPYVTYMPPTNFLGIDRFAFTLDDGRGGRGSSSVEINVISSSALSGNMLPINATQNGWRLRFAGMPGYAYDIQRATNVAGPWGTITNVVATPQGITEWEDINPPSGQAFYRTVAP